MDILETFKCTAEDLITNLESSLTTATNTKSPEYLRGQADYFNFRDADQFCASVEYHEGYGDAFALGECESARCCE